MSSHVEQIKQRLGVADVVGSYIKLQKAGANFKANCPFHSEKTPSFYVSPSREIWHCFGCGKGGDLFEFVKQIEGVEFPEALRILADRAGIKLVFQDPRLANERTRLLDLIKDATFFYQKQLAGHKGALVYLQKRGLKNETLKKFNVGFAPEESKGWRYLVNYLKGKRYSFNEIEKAGLAIKKSGDDFYDRFRGRIMFPLKDVSGRIVGFSGRIYGKGKEGAGKYVNTPQTILYDKSKVLYGLDLAKIPISKTGRCVLVEGQMDVLMSHQAGVENTVAVSGTAMTESHLGSIKRFASEIVMAFDNDEAGFLAAKRSIDLALSRDFNVLAVPIKGGKDPADLVLENPEIWRKTIDNASHVISFYLDILKEKLGDTREFKLNVSKNVLPYILSVQNEVDKSFWISEISKRAGIPERAIFEELEKMKRNKRMGEAPARQNQAPADEKKRRKMIEERLAGIIGWSKKELLLPESVKFYILDFLSGRHKEEMDKLSLEAELLYKDSKDLEREIADLSRELRKEQIKEEMEERSEKIRVAENKKDREELAQQMDVFKNLSRELNNL